MEIENIRRLKHCACFLKENLGFPLGVKTTPIVHQFILLRVEVFPGSCNYADISGKKWILYLPSSNTTRIFMR